MIPPRRNRVDQRTYDEHLYKERHLVECFINKMKWYRRIFSRFEKLAARYFGFLSFVVLSPLLSGSVEMSTEPRGVLSELQSQSLWDFHQDSLSYFLFTRLRDLYRTPYSVA